MFPACLWHVKKKKKNQGYTPIGSGSTTNVNPLICPCKDITAFDMLICMSKEAQSHYILFFTMELAIEPEKQNHNWIFRKAAFLILGML